jgi:DNA-binding transcriptional ArsR family regulator
MERVYRSSAFLYLKNNINLITMERLETILDGLGLDNAMVAVFTCLADKTKATMEEIFEQTALSRNAISTALKALEAAGAVKREGECFGIEDVQSSLMAMLPSRFEELKAKIYAYRPSGVAKECPMVEVRRDDASAVPSFTAKNIDAALQSIDIISRSLTWLDDRSLNAARAAVQRGVKIRVITAMHPGLKSDVRALADAGIKVRCHEYSGGTRFIMADAEVVAFSIGEPSKVTGPKYFGLIVRDRDVCEKILEYIFEPAWKSAEVVEEYRI